MLCSLMCAVLLGWFVLLSEIETGSRHAAARVCQQVLTSEERSFLLEEVVVNCEKVIVKLLRYFLEQDLWPGIPHMCRKCRGPKGSLKSKMWKFCINRGNL